MRTKPIMTLLAAATCTAAAAQTTPPPVTISTVTSPVPAPPVRARPGQPVPLTDFGQLITMKDYPEAARNRREEGMTGFVLTINRAGLPTDCVIMRSSGSPRLDSATCLLARQRARFDPAVDAEGKPTAGLYSGTVNWRLDRIREAPLPGTVTRKFDVSPDGAVSNCRITKVTGSAASQYRVGPTTCRYPRYSRWDGPIEARKTKRVTEVETITVQPVPTTP